MNIHINALTLSLLALLTILSKVARAEGSRQNSLRKRIFCNVTGCGNDKRADPRSVAPRNFQVDGLEDSNDSVTETKLASDAAYSLAMLLISLHKQMNTEQPQRALDRPSKKNVMDRWIDQVRAEDAFSNIFNRI